MNTNRKNKKMNRKPKAKGAPSNSALLRYGNMINSIVVTGNGYQKPLARGKTISKFVDTNYTQNVSSVGNVLTGICGILQGITVNQRTGDNVFWKSLYINYDISTQNVDIFNTSRVIIFQWHPNSFLAAPAVTDILQIPSLRSMYDWQFSNQFTILYDRVHCQSGLGNAPASSGNQGYFGHIPFTKGCKIDAQYAPATSFGSEQFFILVISDSLVAPFPLFTASTRIIYSED